MSMFLHFFYLKPFTNMLNMAGFGDFLSKLLSDIIFKAAPAGQATLDVLNSLAKDRNIKIQFNLLSNYVQMNFNLFAF